MASYRSIPKVLLASVTIALLLPPSLVSAAALSKATYAYDPAGRLQSVVDPAAGVAVYHYDAAGNITSISRMSASSTAVLGFSPVSGEVGTKVTISGTA